MDNTMLLFFVLFSMNEYLVEGQNYRTKYQPYSQLVKTPPSQNYNHLSDIPFEHAIRAVFTPERDYVPIHEAPQEPPLQPPRPQPIRTEENALNIPPLSYNFIPITQPPIIQPPIVHPPIIQPPIVHPPKVYSYMNNRPNDIPNYFYHNPYGPKSSYISHNKFEKYPIVTNIEHIYPYYKNNDYSSLNPSNFMTQLLNSLINNRFTKFLMNAIPIERNDNIRKSKILYFVEPKYPINKNPRYLR